MIKVLSTLFMQARVKPTVNNIEQICRCLCEQSNALNLCLKSERLLNYVIYDKMTCMLHLHLLAVIISRNVFFATFLIMSQHPAP